MDIVTIIFVGLLVYVAVIALTDHQEYESHLEKHEDHKSDSDSRSDFPIDLPSSSSASSHF